MQTILSKLAILYAFILIGYFLGLGKKDLLKHTSILSFLVANVFLPTKTFRTFAEYFTTSYLRDNYWMILISLGLLLVLHFGGMLTAKIFRQTGREKGIYEYTIPISNYGYMGYPLVESIFGSAALTNMILFCLPFSLYTYTVGYMKLTGGKASWRRLLNAPTLAAFLGMAIGLLGIKLPQVAYEFLGNASSCVGPVAMLLTGLTLSEFTLGRMLKDRNVYLLTAIRLVLIPAVVYFAFKGLGFDKYLAPALLVAAMPCGLNTIIFPKNTGGSPELGAKLALISHLCSILTLPLWLSLI